MIGDMARQFAYSALQRPLTAANQLIDAVAHTNLQEKCKFMSEPAQAEFGTARWHAEQIASGAGAAVPYLVAMVGTRFGLKLAGAESAAWQIANLETTTKLASGALSAEKVASTYRTAEAITAGFVNSALFDPTEPSKSLVGERFHDGLVGSVTMGTLHAASNQFSAYTKANVAGANIFNKMVTSGAAGSVAGVTGAVTDSLTRLQVPNLQDTYKTAYSMAFTGSTLAAVSPNFLKLHQPKSSFPELARDLANNPNIGTDVDDSIHSFLASGIVGKANLTKAKIAGALGLREEASPTTQRAMDTDGGPQEKKGTLPKLGTRDLTPIERIELVAALEKTSNHPMFTSESLDRFYMQLKDVAKDWQVEPIEETTKRLAEAQQKVDAAVSAAERSQKETFNGPATLRETDGGFEVSHEIDDKVSQENLKAVVAERDARKNELETLHSERARNLQTVVNNFLAENNLPAVDLSVEDLFTLQAAYGSGRVYIDSAHINTPELTPTQFGLLTHEITHLVQDVLRIRFLADRLGVNTIDDSSIQRVAEFTHRFGLAKGDESVPEEKRMSPAFIESVLRLRNNVRLSLAENLQALKIIRSMINYDAPPWVLAEQQLASQYGARHSVIDGKMKVRDVVDRAKDSPSGFKSEFGLDEIPQIIFDTHDALHNRETNPWINKYRDFTPEERARLTKGLPVADAEQQEIMLQFLGRELTKLPYDEDQLRAQQAILDSIKPVFTNGLPEIERKLDRYGRKNSDWYYNNALERQAHPAGVLGYLQARLRYEPRMITGLPNQ